ncbi:HIT family protein [Candidatus Saccharibacteria bacterium]|nr:HIT family protein [Candidatus Saccharibacteria bacterium]
MSTIFTKIINNEIPSRKVYEDEDAVAFLDIDQKHAGHLLVVPRSEVDKFYDMSFEEFGRLMEVAHKLAGALEKATGLRTKLEIIGVDVPHTHVHLVPMGSENKLNWMTEDEIAEKVRQSVEGKT